jgi:outer membrane protein OmpA-like peptidoglycan-associated protein
VAEVRDFLQSEKVQFSDKAESIGFGEDFKQSKIQSENRKVVIYFNKQKEINFKERENDLADDVKLAKKGELIVLKQMLFYNMSPVLKPNSKPILNELLSIMQKNPSLKIEIQGHICCEIRNEGTELSTARARTIFDFLVQNNINQTRLSFKGFGNSRPLHPIPEKSELQQNENRRVEILIVEN